MILKKLTIFIISIFQLSACENHGTLADVLYKDFSQFAYSPREHMTDDEFLFRALCFISATFWATKICKSEETFSSYINQFGAFLATAPLVAFFYNKYFKKNISISREVFNSFIFLCLKASSSKEKNTLFENNPYFKYHLYAL